MLIYLLDRLVYNVQEASFDIGELATLELNVVAENVSDDENLEAVSGVTKT